MADGTPASGRDGPAPELVAALGAALMEASWQEGLIVCDAEWRLVYASPPAEALLKLEAGVGGKTLWAAQPALQGGVTELYLKSAMASREAVEFVAPAHDREDAWIEVRALPLPAAMAFLLRDVTERERGERRLRQMNVNLRLAHAAARAASWSWRRGGPIRWIDPDAARKLVGLPSSWTRDQSLNEWMQLVAPHEVVRVQAAIARLVETGEATWEVRAAGVDGIERWLETRGQVVERDPEGAVTRAVGVTIDVTSRQRAEAALRAEIAERQKAEAHQKLLINELNHRVKNTLASVQSIARQTLKSQAAGPALELFDARLQALAWTHDVLTREHWAGASLEEMVRRIVLPHEGPKGGRFVLSGPPIRLSPQKALALAMGLHELATNAVKYGALSTPKGRVRINWGVTAEAGQRPELILRWREVGGPRVAAPARRGFGSRLIEKGLASELGGHVEMAYAPSGLRCVIHARLD